MKFWFYAHAYAQKPTINAHSDISSETRGLSFGPSLHLHPYFVYESNEGFGESAYSILDNAIKNKISYAD